MERRRRAARAPHEVPQALHDEPKTGSQSRLLTPGFRAIVATQVFSLLGIEILQFVLPLHLLNLTGSGTLYGGVVAAGFVPYIALSPMGGVIADRTRKRGVMAALDAVLALIMLGYLACSGSQHLVGITVFVLMVAFAAQAIYHPCVQSALPLVVPTERIPQAAAVANQVSMITGIGGPVIGGMVFGFFGLAPIVVVAAVSFAVSSALVLAFVRIPYEPPVRTEGVLRTAAGDIRDALHFLRMRPVLWQIIAAATLINLFGSAHGHRAGGACRGRASGRRARGVHAGALHGEGHAAPRWACGGRYRGRGGCAARCGGALRCVRGHARELSLGDGVLHGGVDPYDVVSADGDAGRARRQSDGARDDVRQSGYSCGADSVRCGVRPCEPMVRRCAGGGGNGACGGANVALLPPRGMTLAAEVRSQRMNRQHRVSAIHVLGACESRGADCGQGRIHAS